MFPKERGVAWGLGLFSLGEGGCYADGVIAVEGRGLPLPAPPSAQRPARLLRLCWVGSVQCHLTQRKPLSADGVTSRFLLPSMHISNKADDLVLFLPDLFLTTSSGTGTSQFEIWENLVRNLFFEAFLNDGYQ